MSSATGSATFKPPPDQASPTFAHISLYDENGQRRTAYSFRHYYAERYVHLHGANLATFDELAQNMGTKQAQIESHYVRKGQSATMHQLILDDPTPAMRIASTGVTERDEAARKISALEQAHKNRKR